MAVDALVAFIVHNKLDKFLREEAQLLGVHGEIKHIREELNKMRSLLKDADIKQKDDEDVRDWMEDIRDICFDVDDVIDILVQLLAAQGRHGFVERLKRRISDQITRYKVGKEINRIKLNIKGISRRRESWEDQLPPPSEKIEKVRDDQLTNEERPRDVDERRQEASSSSRNLQAHRPVSTLPGGPEEAASQEELNRVGQQLVEEKPRPSDGNRNINEGKLEVSSSTPGFEADRRFSTLLGDSKEVGLQEGINTVGQQFVKEEPGLYDDTMDIDEGRLEASSSAQSLQADRQFSTRLGESEEVGLPEEINTVSVQLIKEQPSPCDVARDIDEGRLEASSSAPCLQADGQFSTLLGESEEVGLQEEIDSVSKQLIIEEPSHCDDTSNIDDIDFIISDIADIDYTSDIGENWFQRVLSRLPRKQRVLSRLPLKKRVLSRLLREQAAEEAPAKAKEAEKRKYMENLINSAPRLREVSKCSVPPEKTEKVITRVDDQLTYEERTRDIDEGRQEASSSSRDLQAHRPVSTLPGEPEEVGLQEEINTVGQQLIEEEPRLWDGTRDISEGKLEASSSAPGLKADRVFSTLLGDSEDVGLQEGINTVGQQLIKEEPGPYDDTRDFDEGGLEASSSAPSIPADTLLGESEEVGLQEEVDKVREQLIKEEPSHCDDTSDIDEGPECRDGSKNRKMQPKWSEQVLASSKPSLEGPPDDGCSSQKETLGAKHPRAYYHSNVQGCAATKHVQRPQEDPSIFQKEQVSCEAVVPYIVGKLGDLLIQEAQLLFAVHWEVGWIAHELNRMQYCLKDAYSEQNKDLRVKKWVSDIIDVSCEIEDVIETFIDSESRMQGLVRGLKKPISYRNVAKQIKQIMQKISVISRGRRAYGIRVFKEGGQEASSWIRDLEGRRRDSVMFEEPQLDGQDEEFRTVRDQLMTVERRRRVISIFGTGGSGKTALAKKILNDVKDHFDCHALVYVSQQCKFEDVLVRIIKGVAGHSAPNGLEKMDERVLGSMLRYNYLRRKRYLVVLDDIWTTEAWVRLSYGLPNERNGSRVLVTTPIRDVALHANPSGYHHEMRLLSGEESWELFMKKIFPGKDPLTACPSELEETGRKILKKCGGLPLAILVLGGLLATKDKRERAWSEVLESIPENSKQCLDESIPENSKQCLDILSLSYWGLPFYLKPCFLYAGLFPEGYEISAGKLIRLWIAEGFIQRKDNRVMEDVAEYYLEELVSRSMIQVASKRSNGSIRKCRIHNLLRELSITKARENNFFTVHNDNDTRSSSTGVRRLAIYGNIDGDWTKNHSIENLRSIFYFLDSKFDVLKLPNTSSKLLRVMNVELEEHSEVSLPKEVGEFVHLKFLEGSGRYKFQSIPPSIGNLSSLQTLKVFHSAGGKKLPNTIWNLKELRHLNAFYCDIEGHPHLSNLTNLQTLSLAAGSWIEEGLGKLTFLRKLAIVGDLSSYHDTLPYSIEKLGNLRSLKLCETEKKILQLMPFTHHPDLYKICFIGCIKKLPELPSDLVELCLIISKLKQDAISMLEKLQHLKILKLSIDSYISRQMICSPGGFPRLELLELKDLLLEEWIVEEGAMISLKSVLLFGMSRLRTVTVPERVRALLKRY